MKLIHVYKKSKTDYMQDVCMTQAFRQKCSIYD